MHRAGTLPLFVVPLVSAIALPIGYGIYWDSCAPSSVFCLFGGACLAVCSDPWSQVSEVALVGLIMGVVPGLATYVGTGEAQRPASSGLFRRRSVRATWPLAVSVLVGLVPGIAMYLWGTLLSTWLALWLAAGAVVVYVYAMRRQGRSSRP